MSLFIAVSSGFSQTFAAWSSSDSISKLKLDNYSRWLLLLLSDICLGLLLCNRGSLFRILWFRVLAWVPLFCGCGCFTSSLIPPWPEDGALLFKSGTGPLVPKVNSKVVPGSLFSSIWIFPPKFSHSYRQMCRPNPIPPVNLGLVFFYSFPSILNNSALS